MVKIVYRVVVKQGKNREFKKLAEDVLIPQANRISGCILFSMFENKSNPREFIFYETWEDSKNVEEYYKNLIAVMGKNSFGGVFPDKLNDFIEEEEDMLHEA